MGRQAGQAETPRTLTVTRLNPWSDAIALAADACAARLQGCELPDLSRLLVLLPSMHHATALRERVLARSGHAALLGPRCETLTTLAASSAARRRERRQEARLLLYSQLREHPALYGGGDPWQLAEAIIELFEAFEDADAVLPDSGELDAAMARGYGIRDRRMALLRRESKLVRLMWSYWREATADAPLGATAAALRALDEAVGEGAELIVAGLDTLPAPLLTRLADWAADGRAQVLWAGDEVPAPLLPCLHDAEPDPAPSPLEVFFDAALAPVHANPRDAAAGILVDMPDPPANEALTVARAGQPEHEARIVDLATRRWLVEASPGARLAIVTEDRRLARRVRALLARAGVVPDDPSGWALSTTSAAAALERWLETVESDFRHGPLIDLLKTPFCRFDDDPAPHLHTVWLFERYIVRMEGVTAGIGKYRHAIASRAERSENPAVKEHRSQLAVLVDRVERAAEPLLPLARGPGERPAAAFLDALAESLGRLGMRDRLAGDAAGRRVLEELAAMRAAATARADVALDWAGFRTWLGRALEQALFRAHGEAQVQILNLAGAADGRFDSLIMAGLDATHLPGNPRRHPFFNDAVLKELGLETWVEERRRRSWRFRRALSRAPRRLLTWCEERDGEPQAPSPWLEALFTLHELCWHAPPFADAALLAHASDPDTLVTATDAERPHPPVQPAPGAVRVPAEWSVTAHQQLIDCPYRFFAAQCLRLDAPETLTEEMSAQEFGTLVHRCLERFRREHPVLPGRDQAIAALRAITDEVFAGKLEESYRDAGLVLTWRRSLPAFVEWELEREAAGARLIAVESRHRGDNALVLTGQVRLGGKIDRVEQDEDGVCVLDYKTGRVPDKHAIADGEDVQAASYALIQPHTPVTALEYLKVVLAPSEDRLRSKGLRDAEAVPRLLEAVRERLLALAGALAEEAPLPANGATETCQWCEFSVLCRRDAWFDDAGE